MFIVMMMSNSSSIAATKSMTVRLSHSRSPAKVVESASSMPFLLKGSIDQNSPMPVILAAPLLRILDILVDQGDRRSAALQLTEAFREVKLP